MHKRLILWSMIAAFSLILIGFFIGAAITAASLGAVPETQDDQTEMGHSHDLMEYTGENPPSVELIATKDSKSGYNLEFVTENFEWAPQANGQEHVDGQGHAHLYVNDVKVARPYGPYFHVSAQPGDVIHVTLNNNMHMAYAVDRVEVGDEVTLE